MCLSRDLSDMTESFQEIMTTPLPSDAPKEQQNRVDHMKEFRRLDLLFEDWADDVESFMDGVETLPGRRSQDMSTQIRSFAKDLRVRHSFGYIFAGLIYN